MAIAAGSKVTMAYALCLRDGTVVETMTLDDPFTFVVGDHEVLPALEQQLLGRDAGETFAVALAPDDAYGGYDDAMVQRIGLIVIEDGHLIVAGERYRVETADGVPVEFRASEVGEEYVEADFNHPLCGQTLQFYVRVLAVE